MSQSMRRRRSVRMKLRVMERPSCQIRFAAAGPYRRVNARRSSSGSCISSAELAAVLPCPTAPASSTTVRKPAFAKVHAITAPVSPPPTMTTSAMASPRSGTDLFVLALFTPPRLSQMGVPRRSLIDCRQCILAAGLPDELDMKALDTTPYWTESASVPRSTKIDTDERCDVLVIGGGITGLTAAYLLSNAGKSVVLLERSRLAEIDTGHTSAHLTMVIDTRLTELVKHFGRDHARAVWDAGIAAMWEIEAIAQEQK